jgi:hypothetical protein
MFVLSLNSTRRTLFRIVIIFVVIVVVVVVVIIIIIITITTTILLNYTRCGYEVPGMILLQASVPLYLQRTFEVLPLSSYALSPTMLPLLETFLKLLSCLPSLRFLMSSLY